jgi:RimJ/RimL family protein N-acetyltransferase
MSGEKVKVHPVTLRTQRLLLRPWRTSDVAPLADLYADPRVQEFYQRTLERSESDLIAARIQARFERDGYGLWAAELPGEADFIGFIGLQMVPFVSHFTPALELGWQLAYSQWGKGLATEGARAALAFAHDELGYEEVVAMTAVMNRRSWRVMEKLGMTRDPLDDFDVPVIPEGHPLRRHVLYRHHRAH